MRGVSDAERRPGMAPGTVKCDPIASRTERAVHDALDAGAVQRYKSGRPDGRTAGRAEQMPDSTQVTGAFFSDCCSEQDRPSHGDLRVNQRLAHRDERREPARIIGDPRTLEARSAPRHRYIELRAEYGVEMCAQ